MLSVFHESGWSDHAQHIGLIFTLHVKLTQQIPCLEKADRRAQISLEHECITLWFSPTPFDTTLTAVGNYALCLLKSLSDIYTPVIYNSV